MKDTQGFRNELRNDTLGFLTPLVHSEYRPVAVPQDLLDGTTAKQRK